MNLGELILLPKHATLIRVASKIALGISLLSLFLTYQPILSLPPLKQSVAKANFEQTQQVIGQAVNIEFKLPHPGYVSTYYSSFHPGIDIAAGLGMPVRSVAKGKVVNQGLNFWGLGLIVEVEHDHGYKSLYAHLGKIYTQKDQLLEAGDLIGEVGMTGNTSGPHTHFELTKSGTYVNPSALLPKLPDIATAWGDTSEFSKALVASPSAKLTSSAGNTKVARSLPKTTPSPIPTLNLPTEQITTLKTNP